MADLSKKCRPAEERAFQFMGSPGPLSGKRADRRGKPVSVYYVNLKLLAVRCDAATPTKVIVRVVSYGRIQSNLFSIGHCRRVIHKRGWVELQHVTRSIDVRDRAIAENRIEHGSVQAVADRPNVGRPRDKLVLPLSKREDIVCSP